MFDYTGGYFSFPDPKKAALLPRQAAINGTFNDALPPEYILGRVPRRRISPNSLATSQSPSPRPAVSSTSNLEVTEPEIGKEARLVSLPASAPKSEIERILKRDGAVILENAMPVDAVDTMLKEMEPFLQQTAGGADKFSGFMTRRTGAVVSRSKASWDFVKHPKVLGACDSILLQSAKKYQLHLTQLIAIGPGEQAQTLHRDRNVWGDYLTRDIEPEVNVLWALTEFTRANGATRVVPGSNHWDYNRIPKPEEIGFAEMSKGSVLLYTGSVIHSGGANKTDKVRIAMNVDYSLGWLKQEENQFLSVPPELAKDMPSEITDLIGYQMADYVGTFACSRGKQVR